MWVCKAALSLFRCAVERKERSHLDHADIGSSFPDYPQEVILAGDIDRNCKIGMLALDEFEEISRKGMFVPLCACSVGKTRRGGGYCRHDDFGETKRDGEAIEAS